MEKLYFRDISFDYTQEQLFKFITGRSGAVEEEDLNIIKQMMAEAEKISNPRAVCGIAEITGRSEQWIDIEGTRITWPLVIHNLENTRRVFPHVATCGTELEVWSQRFSDPLEQYWADQIKLFFLGQIRSHMTAQIRQRYFPVGHMSAMNPGSLAEWPLSQQAVLFEIVGNVTQELGVGLTDSFLMLPSKSVSGFFFSSKESYENCQFCPILSCPGRRAPYRGESGSKAGE